MIVSANTVPHEGTIFMELGYVHNPSTDEWQAPTVLAHCESACTAGTPVLRNGLGTPVANNTESALLNRV